MVDCNFHIIYNNILCINSAILLSVFVQLLIHSCLEPFVLALNNDAVEI